MSAEALIASHLRLACEAHGGARLLQSAGNRNAAYLAEQSVEQIVLAIAQAESVHFPRSVQHQLDTMVRAFPEANPFRDRLRALVWLEAYATTFRYPRTRGGLPASPPPDRLASALDQLASLISEVAIHFDVDLGADAADPAAHSRPPRS